MRARAVDARDIRGREEASSLYLSVGMSISGS